MDAVGRAAVPPSCLLKGGFLGILNERARRLPPEAPVERRIAVRNPLSLSQRAKP
jgi:hypothetical protein